MSFSQMLFSNVKIKKMNMSVDPEIWKCNVLTDRKTHLYGNLFKHALALIF